MTRICSLEDIFEHWVHLSTVSGIKENVHVKKYIWLNGRTQAALQKDLNSQIWVYL